MLNFKDHFSGQSAAYARYRPDYPPELFQFLASLTARHELAWDAGTGNGQAAISLAEYYTRVIATDPSSEQISRAIYHDRVEYYVQKAEDAIMPEAGVDLVTIAQALHWFDWNVFYTTVKQCLHPGGIIAAWCYGLPSVSSRLDSLIHAFHNETLGPYWLPENWLIVNEYASIPFPFTRLDAPQFYLEKKWSLEDFLGFISTWSALQHYRRDKGTDPLPGFAAEVKKIWGDPSDVCPVTWKLTLWVGR